MNTTLRRRRRVAIDAVMALVILVLMVQMWMLTATLESYLAGHHRVALPALLSSLVLLGFCGFLYRMVTRMDRAGGPADPPATSNPPGPWRVG
jgi:hypothetical protein